MAENSNIFAEFQRKKQTVAAAAQKALDFGWIKDDDYKSIIKKLDDDKLIIGVIGQMKCGKSTFLNSFIFEDDVLPAATTPMTAALSVITYGPEKKIEAEFYTKDEWAEQKMTASQSLDDVTDELLKSKIQSAKELVEKSTKLPLPVDSLLGQTKSDTLENLIDYVGADGRYVSITKAVKIFYPKEELKGVEIVDTPGFNDPIVSREERTKEFLRTADVVLLMLYAGQPFSSTDRQILFKNVGSCGTGRVLIGINKYDIPYEKGESEEEIRKYVENQLRDAAEQEKNSDISEILKRTVPVSLSANMALLAEMPMTKVDSVEAYSFAYKRYCDIFEVSSQAQLREKSRIETLINQVRDVIEKEKAEILIRKPTSQLKAAGENIIAQLGTDEQKQLQIAANANKPDDELEDKIREYAKVEKSVNKKLDNLSDCMSSEIRMALKKASRDGKDILDAANSTYNDRVAEGGSFWKEFTHLGVDPEWERDLNRIRERAAKQIKEVFRNAEDDCLRVAAKCANDCAFEIEEVISGRIEDYDAKSLSSSLKSAAEDVIDKAGSIDNLNVSFHDFENPSFIDNHLEPLAALKDDVVKVLTEKVRTAISEMSDELQTLKDDKAGRKKRGEEAQAKADELKEKRLAVEAQLQELKSII